MRHLPVPFSYMAQQLLLKCASRLQRLPLGETYISLLGTNLTKNARYSSSSSTDPMEEKFKKIPGEMVKFTFVTHKGEHVEVEGECGATLKKVAESYDSLIEGACEGVLACTTCHVYVPDEVAHVFEEASNKEEDLLDSACFLKPNSRLGCQLKVSKDIEGAKFYLPKGTVNMQVDGKKAKKH